MQSKMDNVNKYAAMVKEASSHGAKIIVFPEGGLGIGNVHMHATIYDTRTEYIYTDAYTCALANTMIFHVFTGICYTWNIILIVDHAQQWCLY